jgi:hypothetical protein
MTARETLVRLDTEYNATAVKNLARHLRDTKGYDGLRISISKGKLLGELEKQVRKKDLLAAIKQVLPHFWL